VMGVAALAHPTIPFEIEGSARRRSVTGNTRSMKPALR
jgi:hypothetical protein